MRDTSSQIHEKYFYFIEKITKCFYGYSIVVNQIEDVKMAKLEIKKYYKKNLVTFTQQIILLLPLEEGEFVTLLGPKWLW